MTKDQIEALLQKIILEEDGRVVVRIGLLATFYFMGGHTPAVRNAVAACFDDYWQICGPRLRWAANESIGRWVDIQKNAPSTPREGELRKPPNEPWSFYYHGGQAYDEASDFRIGSLGTADWEQNTSPRACPQLGEIFTRTDQNQTRNTVL